MGRGNSDLIKDNQSKDNKDSKHHWTTLKNSAAIRSKTKGAATNQENTNLPPSKSAGRTNHHLTVPVVSPPKPTNDVVAVTPDNRKPIDVDGEDSVTESIISIDDNKMGGEGSDDAMNVSGSTTAPTGSNSTENVVTVNFSSTENDAGNNNTNDNTVIQDIDIPMGGVNSEHNAGKKGADSKAIDQIEREINDLLSIIGSNTGDTSGIDPDDLLSGGALNVAKAELAQLRRSLEEKKTSTRDSGIGKNSGNVIGILVAGDKEILGSHMIGDKDTVHALAELVLCSNTTNNTVWSISAGNVDNSVTPVR